MAFAALLLGGIVGFISFLMALLVLDYGVLAAFGLYMSTGLGSAILIMSLAWLPVWTRAEDAKPA